MELGNRNGNRRKRVLGTNRTLAFQFSLGKWKTIQKHEEEILYNELDAYKSVERARRVKVRNIPARVKKIWCAVVRSCL